MMHQIRNAYGIIFHDILRVPESSPSYEPAGFPNEHLLSIIDELDYCRTQMLSHMGYFRNILVGKLPPEHLRLKNFRYYPFDDAAKLEQTLWTEYYPSMFSLFKRLEDRYRSCNKKSPELKWAQLWAKHGLSADSIMRLCTDKLGKPVSRKCETPYTRQRSMVTVEQGMIEIHWGFNQGFIPSYVKGKERQIAIVGRLKSLSSSIMKLMHRAAQYSLLKGVSDVSAKSLEDYCIRNDLIGFTTIFPVPEMVGDASVVNRLERVLVEYMHKRPGLKLDSDYWEEYNTRYLNVVASSQGDSNACVELQLRSAGLHIWLDFCSPDARVHYETRRIGRLGEDFRQEESVLKLLDEYRGKGQSGQRMLEREYRHNLGELSDRLGRFTERVHDVYQGNSRVPKYLSSVCQHVRTRLGLR